MRPRLLEEEKRAGLWAGDMAKLVVCLHGMHDALGLMPSMKLGMVEHTYDPQLKDQGL